MMKPYETLINCYFNKVYSKFIFNFYMLLHVYTQNLMTHYKNDNTSKSCNKQYIYAECKPDVINLVLLLNVCIYLKPRHLNFILVHISTY